MNFIEDIQKGREQQKKRMQMRSQYSRKPKASGFAVEVGKFIEFVTGLIPKKNDGYVEDGVFKKTVGVIKGDFAYLIERICDKFPKKKKGYDPLDAAWKRGR